MKLTITERNEFRLVKISGTLDSRAAGPLYDALVACVGEGATGIVVDIARVPFATRAGVRGLIVTAALLRSRRGALWICGACRSTDALLRGLGFNHLLKLAPTLEDAERSLCPSGVAQPASIAPSSAGARTPSSSIAEMA